jgi:hypothetical protein
MLSLAMTLPYTLTGKRIFAESCSPSSSSYLLSVYRIGGIGAAVEKGKNIIYQILKAKNNIYQIMNSLNLCLYIAIPVN